MQGPRGCAPRPCGQQPAAPSWPCPAGPGGCTGGWGERGSGEGGKRGVTAGGERGGGEHKPAFGRAAGVSCDAGGGRGRAGGEYVRGSERARLPYSMRSVPSAPACHLVRSVPSGGAKNAHVRAALVLTHLARLDVLLLGHQLLPCSHQLLKLSRQDVTPGPQVLSSSRRVLLWRFGGKGMQAKGCDQGNRNLSSCADRGKTVMTVIVAEECPTVHGVPLRGV